jgi:hypothetical protein
MADATLQPSIYVLMKKKWITSGTLTTWRWHTCVVVLAHYGTLTTLGGIILVCFWHSMALWWPGGGTLVSYLWLIMAKWWLAGGILGSWFWHIMALWWPGVAYWCRTCGTLWQICDLEVTYWCRAFGTSWHSGDLQAACWWPTLFCVSNTEDKIIAELVFLSIIQYRAIKTQGVMEVWFHAFLPSQYMNLSCQFHTPAILSQYTEHSALVICYINITTNSSNIFRMLL